MKSDQLSVWLEYLERLHPVEIDLGLDRVAKVAQSMGLLTTPATVFTVAGTNGKGSTCAFLSSILEASDYRVGVYSSPHLLRYNERMVINGVEATDQQIVSSFKRIESARDTTSLSYFEFSTLAVLDIFQRSNLDVWLLEVGLGGRLDAVNIIDADVAVVTSIALDHEDWLGSDLDVIGKEKAGIFRAAKPAIYGGRQLNSGVVDEAQRTGAFLLSRGEAFTQTSTGQGWCYEGIDLQGTAHILENLPEPVLPSDNAATAICALHNSSLSIPDSAVYQGIQNARLSGRYQQFTVTNSCGYTIPLVLDVAHNPQASEALCQRLEDHPVEGQTLCVLAMLADKDIEGVIQSLAPVCDAWLLSQVAVPRACPVLRLEQALAGIASASVSLYSSVENALIEAVESSSGSDRVLVVGSFFTVAQAIEVIGRLDADPA
ncbi:bifunctional tetrahydrofolate synthase/dihydrofolate synthase [Aestuariirhabdus sp. Z084]|uniref:bifunctional tetrahydrofolate synthase/dihydrofolate synthase n=1 Tax=Aestuariirhabdus haliotis TaxID=2918751 RepID=UPI00201B435C|nr:bifunctional tetrahydrofolate synthase/dihydrofolate synthase [Aestuariirhabdus haliotis]MCL6414546.1 bifunctional tetrahydrofolate synthase/dihydrofolate synthase [Aestuariirhabdus haliotis]MCL6418472.1 bifunctional tetrahydrofolate synthase/dihydrofolate synthase [Aestuariirhabdus haliotis]